MQKRLSAPAIWYGQPVGADPLAPLRLRTNARVTVVDCRHLTARMVVCEWKLDPEDPVTYEDGV